MFFKRTTGNQSKNEGCQPKAPRVAKNGYQPTRSKKKSSPMPPPKKRRKNINSRIHQVFCFSP
jgi:hypothetical protein